MSDNTPQSAFNILSTPDDQIPQKFEDEDSFSQALARGINAMEASAGEGMAVIGKKAGLQGFSDFGKEIADSHLSEAEDLGQPRITSFHQINTDEFGKFVGDTGDYINYAVSQIVPSIMTGLGGAAVGAAIGGIVAPGVGAIPGGILGSLLPGILTNTGEIAENAKEHGVLDGNEGTTIAAGTLMAGLGTLGISRFAAPVIKPLVTEFGVEAVGSQLVKMGMKEAAAKEAVAQAGVQGAIGAGSATIEELTNSFLTGKELDINQFKDRVENAALIGAVAGGGMGSFSGSAGAILNNSEFKAMNVLNDRITKVRQASVDQYMDEAMALGPAQGSLLPPPVVDGRTIFEGLSYNDALTSHGKTLQEPGFWGMVGDYMGRKSVTYLDNAGTFSPTLRKIRNSFMREEGPQAPPGFDIFENTAARTAEYLNHVDAASQRMTGPDDVELLGNALRDVTKVAALPAHVKDAYDSMNELRGKIHFDALEHGIKTGFLDDYMTRLWNVEALRKEPDAQKKLVDLAAMHAGMPENIVRGEILPKITRGQGVILDEDFLHHRVTENDLEDIRAGHTLQNKRVGQLESAPKNNPLETKRVLAAIPDSELASAGLIETNPFTIMKHYSQRAAKRIEYVKEFGRNEEKLTADIIQSASEMRAAGRAMTRNELNRVYMLADAFNGMYKPITHPLWQTINSGLMVYQYLRVLPLALLGSLTEPYIILSRMAPGEKGQLAKAMVQGFSKPFRDFVGLKKELEFDHWRQAAHDFGVAADFSITDRLASSYAGNAELNTGSFKIPGTEKRVRFEDITDKFFRFNMLTPFTRMNKVVAYGMGSKMIEGLARDLASDKYAVGSQRHRRIIDEIHELGMVPEELRGWANRGLKQEDPYYKTTQMAAQRFTNQVVMHPNPANRPFWQSNPHFALASQLKGFQTVFGNTVVKRWGKQIFQQGLNSGVKNGVHIAGTAMMMFATAGLMNQVRNIISGNNSGNGSASYQIYQAANRIGLTGAPQFALDSLAAPTFGGTVVDPFLGPAASQAIQGVAGLSSLILAGNPAKLRTFVANSIPGMSFSHELKEMFKQHVLGGEPPRVRKPKAPAGIESLL